MGKLPSIFHNNKIVSNNKFSYNSYSSEVSNDSNSFDKDILINYFNKYISISLKNGNKISGVLVSKRGDIILLDNGEYININDIVNVY